MNIRNVRARLTMWYIGVLAALLLIYSAGSLFFLSVSLRQQLDHDLQEDVETVEGQVETHADGSVTLQLHHGDEHETGAHRLVEIWSDDGSLLYRTPQLEGQALGAPPIVGDEDESGIPVSEQLPNGLHVRVTTSTHRLGGRTLVLRVANREENMRRQLRQFGTVLSVGLPLGIILAGIGGYILARKALVPIDAMTRETQKISAEDLGARLSISDPEDELGRLGEVLNNMLGRLQAAFEQLRRFTADASHELRTPLTAIRSVGEVALQESRSAAEYRDTIGSMLEDVDRLTQLVDSLLMLSRADAKHFRLERASVRLLTVVEECAVMLEVLAEEKNQRIDVQGEKDLTVFADRVILRQAIVNLLDNAIKYSPADSSVLLRVRRGEAKTAILDVIDQGPGIPIQHQPHVFDRFYRIDEARTREWGGAGLGLSISRWAIEAHDGHISLTSVDGGGSTFSISLPSEFDS